MIIRYVGRHFARAAATASPAVAPHAFAQSVNHAWPFQFGKAGGAMLSRSWARALKAGAVCCMSLSSVIAYAAPPPASDGSSGSFDAQFGNGVSKTGCGLIWFSTDTGDVTEYCGDGEYFTAFTVPFKSITYDKQPLHAFNFTDMTVESTVSLTIMGSTPAVFLAQQDISFSGQFLITNGAGAAGLPATPTSSNGGPGGGSGGGGGGMGEGGLTQDCNYDTVGFYAGAGGGGGNVAAGGAGQTGYVPPPPPGGTSPTPLLGGPGGKAERASKLQGGGGGGAGGGGIDYGDFFGYPGAPGGGAALFSSARSIAITSTGLIDVSGGAGPVQQYTAGGGGGGAGGDVWFFAKRSFSNAGLVNAAGGPGGTGLVGDCAGGQVPSSDGGSGSGGQIKITSRKTGGKGRLDIRGGSKSAPIGAIDVRSIGD